MVSHIPVGRRSDLRQVTASRNHKEVASAQHSFEHVLAQASAASHDVDVHSRFPAEAIGGLRQARLLGLSVIRMGLEDLARLVSELAAVCGSSGLVWAMHLSQLATLDAYAPRRGLIREWLASVRGGQPLIASSTSELQRWKGCAVPPAQLKLASSNSVAFSKYCSVVSYAEHADAILVKVASGTPEQYGLAGDALVLAVDKHTRLRRLEQIDLMGMRGSCSYPYMVVTHTTRDFVLPVRYEEAARQCMVPIGFYLLGAVWRGLASASLRVAAARSPRNAASAEALRAAQSDLQRLDRLLAEAAERLVGLREGSSAPGLLDRAATAAYFNELKVASSQHAQAACLTALQIVGMEGYLKCHPNSVEKTVRDVLSAAIMVNNHDLLTTNRALQSRPRAHLI